MRHSAAVLLAITVGCPELNAQAQPASIPTVLAQAMFLDFGGMVGKPAYLVGRVPADWPVELIPAGAAIVGGGTVGNADFFRTSTAVFELPGRDDPMLTMSAMAARAGYAAVPPRPRAAEGGFMESSRPRKSAEPLCKGKSRVLGFALADSVTASRVIVATIIEGEAAAQTCAARPDYSSMRNGIPRNGPKNIPALESPTGTMGQQTGSSWSGSSGEIRSYLRTTMPVDSIVTHYTKQLVAAGWKVDGAQLANQGVGMQKFTFRDGEDAWSGMLIVLAAGDRRDIGLRLSMVNAEF